jgi:hypothetical protein
MKCIQCQTDNTLRERTANQHKCKQCGHTFVFEPTKQNLPKRMTDQLFAKSIATLSANNTLYFTAEQMVYDLEKRLVSRYSWRQITIMTTPEQGKLLGYLKIQPLVFIGAALIAGLNSLPVVGTGLIGVSLIHLLLVEQMVGTVKSDTYQRNSLFTPAILQDVKKTLAVLGGSILTGGIALSLLLNSLPVFICSVLLGMFTIYRGIILKPSLQQLTPSPSVVSLSHVQDWVDRWQSINGPIEKLLPATSNQPDVIIAPDVTAYSFDRVIICEEDAIAHFLIANNFHFERNCAILSWNGYPQGIFTTTMEMLRRNPDLKVYALHNCTPRGLSLTHNLHTDVNWCGDRSWPIIDVGLSLRQVMQNRRLYIQVSSYSCIESQRLPEVIRQSFTLEEQLWLDSGAYMELAALAPQQLIRWLNQTIMQTRNLRTLTFDQFNTYYIEDGFG